MSKKTFFKYMVLVLFLQIVLLQAGENDREFVKVFDGDSTFKDTVERIQNNAEAAGWVVLGTTYMHHNLSRAGFDIPPVAIIEICNPKYSAALLNNDATQMISATMPCRISVYRTGEDQIKVAMLNLFLAEELHKGVNLEVLNKGTVEMEKMITTKAGK